MPGSPVEIKLVSNAMPNATRRKIMNLITEDGRSKEDIGKAIGRKFQSDKLFGSIEKL